MANPRFSGKERIKINHPTLRFLNGTTTTELPKFISLFIKQAIESSYCDGTSESIYQQIHYFFKRPLGFNEMVMAAIACSTDPDKPLGNDWVELKLRTQFADRARIYGMRQRSGSSSKETNPYDPIGLQLAIQNRDLTGNVEVNEDATSDVQEFLSN